MFYKNKIISRREQTPCNEFKATFKTLDLSMLNDRNYFNKLSQKHTRCLLADPSSKTAPLRKI